MATGRNSKTPDLVECSLRQGHPVRMMVHGGSMRPMLEEGDEVIVEPVAAEALKAGDLVTYRQGGEVITHLLHFSIGLGGRRRLLLKGRANARGDWPIRQREVLGRVKAAFRQGTPLDLGTKNIDLASATAWAYMLAALVRPRGSR